MNLRIYSTADYAKYTKTRIGETKFGEKLSPIQKLQDLASHDAKYVLFGIPENIGIRANHGHSLAHETWPTFLSAFLNIQTNTHNNPEDVLLLGELITQDYMHQAEELQMPEDADKLGALVEQIDDDVAQIVQHIVEAHKIPIVIGGGHNNAFGIIKGMYLAQQEPLNVLNIDAHSDFRRLEHRHSGNGFSYAKSKEYLDKYMVFGLHKNYTSEAIFKEFDASKSLKYELYEDLEHLTTLDKSVRFKSALNFVKQNFGLELDCDAITDFPSSAQSPSGFSMPEIRTFIKIARKSKSQCQYLHICEAAPRENSAAGKALSYIVSDFIRDCD
ncbi:MAG: formimidoylglutamase [Psychroflexus sp.]|nr:formimidoylglutamase [Psychroflexus sp.]MDN6309638.1 formimidoylglutamase [Psychroflexus sp.]